VKCIGVSFESGLGGVWEWHNDRKGKKEMRLLGGIILLFMAHYYVSSALSLPSLHHKHYITQATDKIADGRPRKIAQGEQPADNAARALSII